MDLHVTPVATPAMVRQLRLRQPSDIARAPMIHVVSFPLAWPMWLRQAGVSAAKAKQAIWVDSFESALQLAENGAGVALGLAPLFVERERLGTVCRPVAMSHPTGGYWLVHRPQETGNPALRAFKRWLRSELAKHG
jgi:DNA-binding transcriptional LysR family regulator